MKTTFSSQLFEFDDDVAVVDAVDLGWIAGLRDYPAEIVTTCPVHGDRCTTIYTLVKEKRRSLSRLLTYTSCSGNTTIHVHVRV
jgi:hypothetical protein